MQYLLSKQREFCAAGQASKQAIFETTSEVLKIVPGKTYVDNINSILEIIIYKTMQMNF